ncbi:hypothetical protein PFISCL1PPCAC_18543, partial [Pristionchus fissidentatus]
PSGEPLVLSGLHLVDVVCGQTDGLCELVETEGCGELEEGDVVVVEVPSGMDEYSVDAHYLFSALVFVALIIHSRLHAVVLRKCASLYERC